MTMPQGQVRRVCLGDAEADQQQNGDYKALHR